MPATLASSVFQGLLCRERPLGGRQVGAFMMEGQPAPPEHQGPVCHVGAEHRPCTPEETRDKTHAL